MFVRLRVSARRHVVVCVYEIRRANITRNETQMFVRLLVPVGSCSLLLGASRELLSLDDRLLEPLALSPLPPSLPPRPPDRPCVPRTG